MNTFNLRIFFVGCLLLFVVICNSQSYNFSSQAEIEAFDPNTKVIDGNLTISGLDITDLSNLSSMDSIAGFLNIVDNPILSNLEGLSSLNSVKGSLTIENNINLQNVDGLRSLNYISGNLIINENFNLLHLDGFISLKTIGRVEGDSTNFNVNSLIITNNNSLESVSGLSSVTTTILSSLRIDNNKVLQSLNGIGGYTRIFRLSIKFNNLLKDLDEIVSLSRIDGYIEIESNNSLLNVDGLKNIKDLYEHLSIEYNNSLLNVDGLISLKEVKEYIKISHNPLLTNLNGLRNLTSVGDDLVITHNISLTNCCGLHDLISEYMTTGDALGGGISFFGNPSGCSYVDEIYFSNCNLSIDIKISHPCVNEASGSVEFSIQGYSALPFYYELENQETGQIISDTSNVDRFIIDSLLDGIYDFTISTDALDEAFLENILLSSTKDNHLSIDEIILTNSSNGFSNGNIQMIFSGGTGPYQVVWDGTSFGSSSDITSELANISFLEAGEYIITVHDDFGDFEKFTVVINNEDIETSPCDKPMDIIILNDISESVNQMEYAESEMFFVNFLKEINIGMSQEQSRASIYEWSSGWRNKLVIPMTGEMSELSNYENLPRSYDSGNTSANNAFIEGYNYLNSEARDNAEKVIILSTDGFTGQIEPRIMELAEEYKSEGFRIITIAFDNAFIESYTRGILSDVASLDVLAIGAESYSLLDQDLAAEIVNFLICPLDPGSSENIDRVRDGVIDINFVNPMSECSILDSVHIHFSLEAIGEIDIPSGTPVSFYLGNPTQAGSKLLTTWLIPCEILGETSEQFELTISKNEEGTIFSVFNDSGLTTIPIEFPITSIEEESYSNNIDQANCSEEITSDIDISESSEDVSFWYSSFSKHIYINGIIGRVNIFNSSGMLVKAFELDNLKNEKSVEEFNNGVYFVKIFDLKGPVVSKSFIKI